MYLFWGLRCFNTAEFCGVQLFNGTIRAIFHRMGFFERDTYGGMMRKMSCNEYLVTWTLERTFPIFIGWWFQTWMLFSISYMGCHPPIDELIFFKMVIAPPTSSAWLTPTQGEIPRDPRVPEIIPDRKKRCCELLAYDLTNNKQDGDNNVGSGYRYVTAGWWFGTWFFWLSIQLGMSSSQLTFIFFGRGRYTTNQTVYVKFHCHVRLQEGSGPLQPQGNRTESLLELLKTHLKTLDWHLESFPSITSSID